mgnify:CR=1 FL=1
MEAIVLERIKQLPPDLHDEVIDFIDFLMTKKVAKRKKRPKLDWMGGLKEYRDQYTSLELQRKALEWRD